MNNVSTAEVDKFNDFATRWWDPQGPVKTLHDINPLRLAFIESQITLTDKTVLDIGCGGGVLSEALFQAGASVTGIDLAEKLLNVARLHQYESNTHVDYLHASAADHVATHGESYDAVTCMEMLEHVPDPEKIVAEVAALTKPGGLCFFSTLNRNVFSFVTAIIAAEYVLQMLPKGTHSYAKFIKPSELADWARKQGLTLIAQQGLHYNPLTKKFFCNSNVSVNYMLCCQKSL